MNETSPPSSTPPPQKRQGLSIASLVLGILSVAGCVLFAGLPAIIAGHIARGRARRQPDVYGGAGLALAGLVMGYIGTALTVVLLAVMAGLLLPAIAAGRSKAQSVQCINNMKQIGLAARMWSLDHKEVFPPDFITMSNELFTPKILVCPDDKLKAAAHNWTDFSAAENASYEFLVPGAKEAEVMNQPAFRCSIHGHLGMGDGSVQKN